MIVEKGNELERKLMEYCISQLTLEMRSMFILRARFEIALHFTSNPTNPMLRFESRIAMSTARL